MIMVVDDDEPIRKTLKLLLTAKGYQVETASDGSDALKKLEMVHPDVILLDVMMTPMDGLAFLRSLIQTQKHKNYNIFVMTGETGITDNLQAMRREGIIRDFIIKPFVFSERLLQEIRLIVRE